MQLYGLETTRLTFMTAVMQLLLGLSIYTLPEIFRAPVYAPMAPFLPYLSTFFFLGGGLLLIMIERRPPMAIQRLVYLIAALPMGVIAILFARIGGWTGLCIYGILSAATAAVPWIPQTGSRTGRRRDLAEVVLALVIGVTGGLMIFMPGQFGPDLFPLLQGWLPLGGLLGLAGSAALLLPVPPRWSAVGAILPAALLFNFASYGGWTGLISWGTLLAVLLPWRRIARIQPPRQSDPAQDPFPVQLDRILQHWIWVLALLVIGTTALNGSGSARSQLLSELVALFLIGYKMTVSWLVPHLGTPRQRVVAHLAFMSAMVGLLLLPKSPIGHGLLVLLVSPPPITTRAAGLRAGRMMLLYVMAIVGLVHLHGYATGALTLNAAAVEVAVTWAAMGVAAMGGIFLAGKQRQELHEASADRELFERRAANLALLNRISMAIRQSLDLDEVLTTTVRELGVALGACRSVIRLRRADGALEVAHEFYIAGLNPIGIGSWAHLPNLGDAAIANETVAIADTRDPETRSKISATSLEEIDRLDVKAVLSAPLVSGGEFLGAIGVMQCDRPRVWTVEEKELIRAVAGQVAVAIVHARIHAELSAQGQQLRAQNDALVETSAALRSQRDQLESALAAVSASEEARSRLIEILEATPDYVSMASLEGERFYINPAGHQLLGYPDRDSALGRSISGNHASFDRVVREAVPTAIAQGSWRGENIFRSEDGREIPVSQVVIAHKGVHGEVAFLSTVARDITEQKRMEEELRASEEKHRALIEKMHDGFFMVDAGIIRLVNPALARMTGYELHELTGMSLSTLFAPDDWEWVSCRYHRRLQGFDEPTSYEVDLLHRDGRTRLHVLLGVGLTTHRGRLITVNTVTDMSERRRMEQALRESEERYRIVVERSPDAIFVHWEGRILFANPAAAQLLGAPGPDVLQDLNIFDLIHPCDRTHCLERLLQLTSGALTDLPVAEVRFTRLDGRPMEVELLSSLMMMDGAPVVQVVGRDITERKQVQEQLVTLANIDSLTDLYNRRRFQLELERVLAEAETGVHRGALLFIDLDQFKYVNDSRGHQAGDRLLRSLATLLRTRVRKNDILGRLGGDEFALLLPGAGAEQASRVAEHLLQVIRSHTEVIDGHPFSVTASIGVALYPEHGKSAEELLAFADMAMYQAKETARNSMALYAPEIGQQKMMESKLAWERRIQEALELDRFLLQCQPILDLRDGEVHRFELLLRMVDDDGSLIPPGAFLETAERFGLITAIDRWVVVRAIQILKGYERSGRRVTLEVNLSGKAFLDPELLPLIQQELLRTGVDPNSLVLEITETSAIANLEQARRFVETLKGMGCRFAVDDFGSGFSSFAYLKHLPVDYLKIDGNFVRNLAQDLVDQHLVRAMVEVARGLGKKIIAEFVGDETTVLLLREYGVDFAQGYYIGKPAGLPALPSLPSVTLRKPSGSVHLAAGTGGTDLEE